MNATEQQAEELLAKAVRAGAVALANVANLPEWMYRLVVRSAWVPVEEGTDG